MGRQMIIVCMTNGWTDRSRDVSDERMDRQMDALETGNNYGVVVLSVEWW